MSQRAARVEDATGDAASAVIEVVGAEQRVRRPALLTAEATQACAREVLASRAGGPHTTRTPILAPKPTIEEIGITQEAVVEAIGEKGSEKRAAANALTKDGLIDLEQGLGYVLYDRFAGMLPEPLEARAVGKRAADKLPKRKEKEKWKEAGRKARRAAEKRGEVDEDAVSAAGKQAAADARAAVEQFEVDVGLPRAAAPAAAETPPEPEQREQYTMAEENAEIERDAAKFMARGEAVASKEATLCIAAAINLECLWRDVYDREEEWEQEKMVAAEAVYMLRMRKLAAAFPDWEVEVPERLKPEHPGDHNSVLCPWCGGQAGRLPWAPAPEYMGFCECYPRHGVRYTIVSAIMGPKFAW